jgi:hypothetical protein
MKMKSIAVSIALVLIIRLQAAAGFAPPKSTLNYPVSLRSGTTISGPITNIDPVNRMIQIKDSDGIIQSIQIDTNVQILRNGTPTELTSLSYNDLVTVIHK